MLKLSPYINQYTHHDYLEPELRKMVEEGTVDILDLTFDADEVTLFDTHSLIKPFLKEINKKSKELVKYYEEDPMYQQLIAPSILKFHGLKGININQVFVGNGNYSLFKEMIAYLLPQGVMIGNGPQFPEFPSYYTALGGKYKSISNKSWEFPLQEILFEIRTNNEVSLIFLDIPSNATGNFLKLKETKKIIEAASKKGIIVIADEAYSNYLSSTETTAKYVNNYPNLITMRSLSKAFDLGGIRFGYTIMSPELAAQFKKIHSAFEPAVFSVLCAKFVLDNQKILKQHAKNSLQAIRKYRKKIIDFFAKMGISPLPSHPNMPQIMFYKKGTNLFKYFIDKKIIVRSGKMYQFTCSEMDDQYIRLRPPLTEKGFHEMIKRLEL